MSADFALGLLSGFAACLGFYLALPHQRWLARPLRPRPARTAGGILLVVALALFCQALQPVVAVFVLAVWVMLLLMLFPYLGALLPAGRD